MCRPLLLLILLPPPKTGGGRILGCSGLTGALGMCLRAGNVWGYRDDCSRAGVKRSLFQALLFMHHGGVVMALPGPEGISRALGVLLNYVGGGFIGKWFLGYSGSYPEYYHPRSR